MTVHARWVRAPHRAGGPRDDGGSVHLSHRRKRKATVCEDFDEQTELARLRETIRMRYLPAPSGSDAAMRARHLITRHLKRLIRCSGEGAPGEAVVRELLGSGSDADRAIADSMTPLGGYLAAIPTWAGPTKTAFERLGAEVEALKGHRVPGQSWGPGTEYTSVKHRSSSTATATANERRFALADIVGCLGHHYTSHLAPGFFSNSDTSLGFDLRYNLHSNPAGFRDVALVAISGCSSLCTLAQRILQACFPSARFLGARTTMPKFAGQRIWPDFRETLRDAATPLLLDNDQDLDAITHVWMQSCITMAHLESIRLGRNQQQLIRSTGLGYAEGDRVSYLTDAHGGQEDRGVADATNQCQFSGIDDRKTLVAPDGFVLPDL